MATLQDNLRNLIRNLEARLARQELGVTDTKAQLEACKETLRRSEPELPFKETPREKGK